MWNFLKENRVESSHRLNLLIITIPLALILLAVVFHIIWCTVVPIHIITEKGQIPQTKHHDIDWSGLGIFMSAMLGGYLGLLYGKSLNKAQEIKQSTITTIDPVENKCLMEHKQL